MSVCMHGVRDSDDNRPSCMECEVSPYSDDPDVKALRAKIDGWMPSRHEALVAIVAGHGRGLSAATALGLALDDLRDLVANEVAWRRRESARADLYGRALREIEDRARDTEHPDELAEDVLELVASTRGEAVRDILDGKGEPKP